MKPEIGISEKNMDKSIVLLSIILSDEMCMYVKTRNFHWNVSGESFMEYHKLFENQYTQIEEIIDAVAERIGKLGGKATGSMKEFIKISRIEESVDTNISQKVMLKELLDDHQTVIIELRKDIEKSADKNKDAGTADFLTSIMESHETIAWILRRYLN